MSVFLLRHALLSGLPSAGLIAYYDADIRNLLRYSEQIDNAAWTRVRLNITANMVTGPDGSLTAEKPYDDLSTVTTHYLRQSISGDAAVPYCLSAYVKAAEYHTVDLRDLIAAWARSRFDVSTGTVIQTLAGTAGIESVGDGWYRIWVSGSATAGNWSYAVVMENGISSAYTGDGSSGIYLWGAQVNRGLAPLPYQQTTDNQTLLDISGNGNHGTLGATAGMDANDPKPITYGLQFDGVDDHVTKLPALGATWTIVNANDTQIESVDSAGGAYVHGVPNAAGTAYNIAVAGGYSGILTHRLHYDRVLMAAEQLAVYRALKSVLIDRGWSII